MVERNDDDDAARLTADFDPLPPESFDSAHEEFTRLRAECPVAHSTAWGGFWALTRFDDIVTTLRDYHMFTTSVQNVVPGLAFTGRRPPLHLDPPEHTWYRRPLTPFFTSRKMREMEPKVRRIAYDLWRPIVEAGGGEICAEFTHKLPGHVFAEFFNLSTELSMRIKEVSVLYDRAVQRKEDALQKQMSLELYKIAEDIIAQRRAEPMDPRDDPASALLAARDDQGNPLPDQLLLGTVRQLIVVGMIAPSVFIGTVVVHLAQHPGLQQQLRENLDLVPAATEEYLRLFTPYRGFARTAKHDVVIGGRLIKKDEPIALVFASANRDEAVFPHGDQFVLNRPNIKDHLAFGAGPHQCAGAPLGRLMLQLSLEALLTLTSRIDVDGEVEMTGWPEWGTLTVEMQVQPAHQTT
ncbi:MAG: monooxygenase YjiB [Chloroflexota bacterium]